MAVSSPASGRRCGHEARRDLERLPERPGSSSPRAASTSTGAAIRTARKPRSSRRARDAALHEVVQAPAGQQREAQHHDDDSRRWLAVVTIGIREAISGNGGMPRTTASMSAPKTATPTRRSVGRRATAAATSTSGSAPM